MKTISNPIYLSTALTEAGISIATSDVVDVLLDAAVEVEARSETYLKIIEETVEKAGGWGRVQSWYVNAHSESYTSTRGLVTLVNALAGLHEVDVYTFNDQLSGGIAVELPLDPTYSSEPNISQRKP